MSTSERRCIKFTSTRREVNKPESVSPSRLPKVVGPPQIPLIFHISIKNSLSVWCFWRCVAANDMFRCWVVLKLVKKGDFFAKFFAKINNKDGISCKIKARAVNSRCLKRKWVFAEIQAHLFAKFCLCHSSKGWHAQKVYGLVWSVRKFCRSLKNNRARRPM